MNSFGETCLFMYIVISRYNLVVSQWVLEVRRKSSAKIAIVGKKYKKYEGFFCDFYDFEMTSFSVSRPIQRLKIS